MEERASSVFSPDWSGACGRVFVPKRISIGSDCLKKVWHSRLLTTYTLSSFHPWVLTFLILLLINWVSAHFQFLHKKKLMTSISHLWWAETMTFLTWNKQRSHVFCLVFHCLRFNSRTLNDIIFFCRALTPPDWRIGTTGSSNHMTLADGNKHLTIWLNLAIHSDGNPATVIVPPCWQV